MITHTQGKINEAYVRSRTNREASGEDDGEDIKHFGQSAHLASSLAVGQAGNLRAYKNDKE